MASENFQRVTTWDEEAWWQMYGLDNYATQLQIPSDDEASRQMYGLNNYATQPQIPSDDEASQQMYGLNNYATQPQITCDEEASRQMPQVQPIFALPTVSPLTPNQPLPRRRRKGKPKPPKYLTNEERQKICQIHEDNPSVTKTEMGRIFGVNRTTISTILKNNRNGKQTPRRTLTQVQPIFALPTVSPLTPNQPLPRRRRKGKPKPPKYLTDEERRKIRQIHQDVPSTSQTETARDFGCERSTISKLLKNKERYLQHGGASHHSVKDAERKPANIGRALEIWALRAETQGIQLTGSEIEERARTFASVGNEESFLQSAEFEEFKQRRVVDGLPSPPSSKILNEGELGVDINKAAPLSGPRAGGLKCATSYKG
ncbi:hypothetical protein V501_00509 [Pseudogymnoascus sp. VKM F-4519 (FW-2642)]|nr:hypothetical protein V501_00509 [Pseudogymnoascus sp. VKM F-4519 (FW-2642)]